MIGIALVWALGFGIAAASLARERDRTIALWAAYGAMIGPVALILLWLAPPGRCSVCRAAVRGWSTLCSWCGNDVRGAKAGIPASAKPLITVAPTKRPGDQARPLTPAAEAAAPPTAAAKAKSKKRSKPAVAVVSTGEPASTAAGVVAAEPAVPVPVAPVEPPEPPKPRVLSGGVYLTGTVSLSAGSRYSLQLVGPALQILGPSDRNPRAVAFERQLMSMDATGLEDRLVISSGGGRNGTVLVFMALDGGKPAAIAQSLRDAVREHEQAAVR